MRSKRLIDVNMLVDVVGITAVAVAAIALELVVAVSYVVADMLARRMIALIGVVTDIGIGVLTDATANGWATSKTDLKFSPLSAPLYEEPMPFC